MSSDITPKAPGRTRSAQDAGHGLLYQQRNNPNQEDRQFPVGMKACVRSWPAASSTTIVPGLWYSFLEGISRRPRAKYEWLPKNKTFMSTDAVYPGKEA